MSVMIEALGRFEAAHKFLCDELDLNDDAFEAMDEALAKAEATLAAGPIADGADLLAMATYIRHVAVLPGCQLTEQAAETLLAGVKRVTGLETLVVDAAKLADIERIADAAQPAMIDNAELMAGLAAIDQKAGAAQPAAA